MSCKSMNDAGDGEEELVEVEQIRLMWSRHEALRSWLNEQESQCQGRLPTTSTSRANCRDGDLDSAEGRSWTRRRPGRGWRRSDHAHATESQQPSEARAFEPQSSRRELPHQIESLNVESNSRFAEKSRRSEPWTWMQPGRTLCGPGHAGETESPQPFEGHTFERQLSIRELLQQSASIVLESSLQITKESPSCASSSSSSSTVLPSSASSDANRCGQHPVPVQPPKTAPPSRLRNDWSSSCTSSAPSSLHSVGSRSAPLGQRRMTSPGDSAHARDRLENALQAFEMATDSMTSDSSYRDNGDTASDGSGRRKPTQHRHSG